MVFCLLQNAGQALGVGLFVPVVLRVHMGMIRMALSVFASVHMAAEGKDKNAVLAFPRWIAVSEATACDTSSFLQ